MAKLFISGGTAGLLLLGGNSEGVKAVADGTVVLQGVSRVIISCLIGLTFEGVMAQAAAPSPEGSALISSKKLEESEEGWLPFCTLVAMGAGALASNIIPW